MSLEINKGLGAIHKTNNASGPAWHFCDTGVAAKKGADPRLLAGFLANGDGKQVANCPRVGFTRIDPI